MKCMFCGADEVKKYFPEIDSWIICCEKSNEVQKKIMAIENLGDEPGKEIFEVPSPFDYQGNPIPVENIKIEEIAKHEHVMTIDEPPPAYGHQYARINEDQIKIKKSNFEYCFHHNCIFDENRICLYCEIEKLTQRLEELEHIIKQLNISKLIYAGF